MTLIKTCVQFLMSSILTSSRATGISQGFILLRLLIISLLIRSYLKKFKNALITLIPKVKHDIHISNFHPISLCNTFYKVLVRVLASRLKKVLHSIIHEAQYSFIKGRDISNIIALAQELCHNFIPFPSLVVFAAKADLFKAFYFINQTSILHKLEVKGFLQMFINWISTFIYDINFSIILIVKFTITSTLQMVYERVSSLAFSLYHCRELFF